MRERTSVLIQDWSVGYGRRDKSKMVSEMQAECGIWKGLMLGSV